MSGYVHVKGLAELQQLMDQLPAKIEANVMRGAMRAGARVVLAEARQQVPVQDGDLRDSLRVGTRSRGGTVTASVKTGHYTARWVEFGTAFHLIKVRPEDRPSRTTRRGEKKYSLKTINKMINRGSLAIGKQFVGPVVSHPGAQAKPYLRPALDSQAQSALLAIGEYIKKRLATKHGVDTGDVVLAAED